MKCSAPHKAETNGTEKQARVGNLDSLYINNLKLKPKCSALHREAGIKSPTPHPPASPPKSSYRQVIQAGSMLSNTKHQSEIPASSMSLMGQKCLICSARAGVTSLTDGWHHSQMGVQLQSVGVRSHSPARAGAGLCRQLLHMGTHLFPTFFLTCFFPTLALLKLYWKIQKKIELKSLFLHNITTRNHHQLLIESHFSAKPPAVLF